MYGGKVISGNCNMCTAVQVLQLCEIVIFVNKNNLVLCILMQSKF